MRVSNLSIRQQAISGNAYNAEKMTRVQKQLMTSQKNLQPSDNLNDTITALYQRTRVSQIDQYQKNIDATKSYINVAHDKITSVSELTRKIRTLGVQAANGPLSEFDRKAIAIQVEELLGEIANLSNASYQDDFLFSGSRTGDMPFLVTKTYNADFGRDIISDVSYQGDRLGLKGRVGNNQQVEVNNSGAEIFWAQNYTVVSADDSSNYVSARDQKIKIDGYSVQIDVGDNIDAIIAKINEAVPSVNAFRQEWPTGENALAIESIYPKKIALEDVEGGTFLREVGLLKLGERGNVPYQNIRENALIREGSLFESIINLRNSIAAGNIERVGGGDLAAIDGGHQNLLKAQSKLSSVQERIAFVSKDLAKEKEYVVERKSQVEDLDIMEASIRYNEWANVHRISLQTAAKLVRPTLLDYM